MKVGDRVGAVLSMDDKQVNLLGFGVYMGDESALGRKNPKLQLDNGKIVWGCECWWGPEEGLKKEMQGKEVVNVDINAVRSEFSVKH